MVGKLTRRGIAAVWVLVAVAVSACGQDATAPVETAATTQVEAMAAGWGGGGDGTLRRLLEQEQQRIERTRSESEAALDSLERVWDAYRRVKRSEDDSPLLVCKPLQYDAETKVIGPEGGDVSMGPHRLYVPRGALLRPTVITAESLTSINVEVRFSPHGLRFLREPTLKMSYAHCDRPANLRPVLVYIDDVGAILEWLTGVNQPKLGEFYGSISHFSKYAMADN